MCYRKLFTILFILFLIAGMSFAQEGKKTGIGIAVIDMQKLFEANMSGAGGTYSSITVPIIISPTFRIEPEVGYFSASQEATANGTTVEQTASSWTIGTGIFPQKVFSDFTLYYGGRVGYISQKTTSEVGTNKDEETTSGFYVAPAIGGEHNFSDHFSIGAEAQVVFAWMTNEEDDRDYDVDLSMFDTRGLVFFRFYF
jgi:hypothetical protein